MKGLVDTTLREGAQTVGVVFAPAAKKELFRRLGDIGVEEIEVGCVTDLDPDFLYFWRFCRRQGGSARLALWSRCVSRDVEVAVELCPDVLSLSIPVSDLHLGKKLGRDRAWALTMVEKCISTAKDAGITVISLGFEDATRADRCFIEEMAAAAAQAGAQRIRLADTVGLATPAEIAALVSRLKTSVSLEIGVHCHNDFGMATANSVAAIEAGADWADVTVLGLGERAGCARLEEVAAFLALRRGHAYALDRITPLARSVAHAAGRTIDPHRPVVGERIFYCETGLHIQGLIRESTTYEPFSPKVIGAERHLGFGVKTGRKEIAGVLGRGGINERVDLFRLTREVRKKAVGFGRSLDAGEFAALVTEVDKKYARRY